MQLNRAVDTKVTKAYMPMRVFPGLWCSRLSGNSARASSSRHLDCTGNVWLWHTPSCHLHDGTVSSDFAMALSSQTHWCKSLPLILAKLALHATSSALVTLNAVGDSKRH